MKIPSTMRACMLLSAASVWGLSAASVLAQAGSVEDIIVTAQRQAQSLQDVPIAVSAFSAEALAEKQINNTTQLQLSLPNITFTKGNFTTSSFTIRGIGDLCVGISCDAATSINMNDMPLFATRIFETEYFDVERVEVLRGPQGTLFGRNATAGSINFVSAKPDADALAVSGEAGYGNYNEVRLTGMLNVPLTSNLAVRVAGFYLRHDGFTKNIYNDESMDGRDMYAFRGSLRWQPTDATTIDLMAYYFREDDDRLRIQKQMCQRDPTGVFGCLPARRGYEYANGNSLLGGTLPSREFLTIAAGPTLGSVGLNSVYGPDVFAGIVNPADPRVVNTNYQPSYLTDELQLQAHIEHDFGGVVAKLSGQYQKNKVISSQDYNLARQNPAVYAEGLQNMLGLATVLPQFQTLADPGRYGAAQWPCRALLLVAAGCARWHGRL
jgi:outer membrane receptor protein involved in Fe transport